MSLDVAPEPRDTHYAVDLDDAPEATSREPVYVDVVARDHERLPIIPAGLRGRANLAATARRLAGRLAHTAGYHAVRLPRYALLAVLWAVVGLFRLAGRQLRWWWVLEQHALRQQAASANDGELWLKLHHEARAARRWRGLVLLGEAAGLATLALALGYAAPLWLTMAAVLVAVPWLAHVGRPVDRPIVHPAVITPRFRKLTADIVLRAYYAAKLGDPVKPDQQVTFGSTMARDGAGSRVLVDLPYGRGFADAVKARDAIASGLDVAISQVFLTRDRSSNRRHVLWVADRDPLAIPAGRTPLLRLQPCDIWQPAPFGLDERGARVAVDLMWSSLLVGAMPRQGKTYSARALALYAALDPFVRLNVYDGKGSPDWRKFTLVAHRASFGLALTRDGDPIEHLIEDLREIKRDVEWRYQTLSALPVDLCPEGKLTRTLARDLRYGMPVRLVVLEEVQEYFDANGDREAAKEIARLLIYLVKVAPAAGVIVLTSTQKPGGMPGDIGTQFNNFRDQHQIRFSLRTGSWQVSDLVLGSGAYSEGFDSSALPVGPEYRGVGILRGASDATPTVRTYLADGEDAERILTAARALRERAGTLSGLAAGEEVARVVRDVLADVRGVFYAGEAWVSWQALAARLAEQLPESYTELTAEAISAQVRAFGVPSVNGKHGGQVLKGPKLDAVEIAIGRRELTSR